MIKVLICLLAIENADRYILGHLAWFKINFTAIPELWQRERKGNEAYKHGIPSMIDRFYRNLYKGDGIRLNHHKKKRS